MLQHNSVAITDMQATQKRILGIAHRIPVPTSRIVSDRTNSQVFSKCGNFGKVKVSIPNKDFIILYEDAPNL
jgi:threonine dehydratase